MQHRLTAIALLALLPALGRATAPVNQGQPVNTVQVGGAPVATGAGASTTGTPRVILASDSPFGAITSTVTIISPNNNTTPIPVFGNVGVTLSTVTIAAPNNNTTPIPISAASLPLPTGAATDARQDTGNASLSSIDTKLSSQATAARQDVLNANVVAQSTTQATAAGQSTGNASLGSIDTKLSSQATAARQDAGNASLGSIDTKLTSQATAANQAVMIADVVGISTTMATAAKQDVLNANVVALSTTATAINAKDFSTSAKQDTGNTSLGSIDTKLTSQATAARQDTGNASLSSIDGKVLTDTQLRASPVPVSAANLPLPANAAQETGGNLATIAGKDFATQATLAATLNAIAQLKKTTDTFTNWTSSNPVSAIPARPSQFPGRTHKTFFANNATATSVLYTVTGGKTLYVTAISLNAFNTSITSTGLIQIADNTTIKVPVSIPLAGIAASVAATPVAIGGLILPEPLQFSTNFRVIVASGTITYSVSGTGYEE